MLEEEKDWLARYQKLSYKERRQLGKGFNPLTFKKVKKKDILGSAGGLKEIKDKVRKKQLWSKSLYEEYRKNIDNTLPSALTITNYFGSWTGFRNSIFTEEEIKKLSLSRKFKTENKGRKPYDDTKLFATIQFLDLKTHKDFVEARKAFPDLVPCQKTIYNHFGGYKNLRKMTLTRNLKSIIEKYIILCGNFKVRRLTPYHCKRNGVDIDWAISQTGSRKKFYELIDFAKESFDFVKSIEEQRKKQGKSNNEDGRTDKAKN